ncbi:hypothetical protein [Kangiella sediminilitoris]|uniref:Uncharacterized protein n=1 Tax=Kangiella sediminilitoris TaxID=1144748 RepID=A0A1B3B9X1_9GAMM|nr:hypothetical protein [Kangiella sediminilitoris]AOE49594.1 hypothetical protein KS2013_872 [Kangiella sediminilitoris]
MFRSKVSVLFSRYFLVRFSFCSLCTLSLFALTLFYSSPSYADDVLTSQNLKVCKSKYALCTTAKCTPIDGTNAVSCVCDVKKGYSVGSDACEDKKAEKSGALVSRYYPVKSFAVCQNDREWAYCLDAPCMIDKKTGKANCTCSTRKGGDMYVITTDKYTPDTCTTDIISSATVSSIMEVTEFLKSSEELPPKDFKILNKIDK